MVSTIIVHSKFRKLGVVSGYRRFRLQKEQGARPQRADRHRYLYAIIMINFLAFPDVKKSELDDWDEFIVLACDGSLPH